MGTLNELKEDLYYTQDAEMVIILAQLSRILVGFSPETRIHKMQSYLEVSPTCPIFIALTIPTITGLNPCRQVWWLY